MEYGGRDSHVDEFGLLSLAATGAASGASVRHGVAPGNRAGPGGRAVRFGSTTVAAPNKVGRLLGWARDSGGMRTARAVAAICGNRLRQHRQ